MSPLLVVLLQAGDPGAIPSWLPELLASGGPGLLLAILIYRFVFSVIPDFKAHAEKSQTAFLEGLVREREAYTTLAREQRDTDREERRSERQYLKDSLDRLAESMEEQNALLLRIAQNGQREKIER